MVKKQSLKIRTITMLIYPDANSIDISGPLQAFSTANKLLQKKYNSNHVFYHTEIIGPKPHPINVDAGLTLLPKHHLDNVPGPINSLFIAGGTGAKLASKDIVIQNYLKATAPKVCRLASVCTGAFILAATGLLNNRRATTHWNHAEQLASEYSEIHVEADSIFTCDDGIYCSAGVTAGIDLALSFIEGDWGHEIALAVARQLVVFLKRPGGQSQFSELLDIQSKPETPITLIQAWLMDNLTSDLSINLLADKAAMSPRHFSRVFKQETGFSPGKYIVRARLDVARNLLEGTHLSLQEITEHCGIGNTETLRRLFWQHFKTSPKTYRERFHNNKK